MPLACENEVTTGTVVLRRSLAKTRSQPGRLCYVARLRKRGHNRDGVLRRQSSFPNGASPTVIVEVINLR